MITTRIILGFLIRIIVIIISPEISDVKNFHISGELFLKTGSVYEYTQGLNPYPPLWILYNALISYISNYSNIPFVYLEKLPILLSDMGIFFLLKKITREKKILNFYIFNPLVIFTGCVLGQFDPIVIYFLILSYFELIKKKSTIRSSIFFSLSICLKTYPLLIFPLFFFQIKNIKKRIIFSLVSIVPFLVIITYFIAKEFNSIKKTYFSYQGVADFGWLGAVKSISAIISQSSINFTPINNQLNILLGISKYFFIIFYIIFLYKNYNSKKPFLIKINLVFLLFYLIVGGVGVQHFFWLIPFLLLADKYSIKIYTILSTLAMIAYVGVQFYEPILKYFSLFIFKTPLYLNLFYLIIIFIFWLYLLYLFLNLKKIPINKLKKPKNKLHKKTKLLLKKNTKA